MPYSEIDKVIVRKLNIRALSLSKSHSLDSCKKYLEKTFVSEEKMSSNDRKIVRKCFFDFLAEGCELNAHPLALITYFV